MSEVTARSVLSQALAGAEPYNQAQRILDHLDRAGWTVERKPRIPEPGLWGVVEATIACTARLNFVHSLPGVWLAHAGGQYTWGELIDPVLVRPGIEEGP